MPRPQDPQITEAVLDAAMELVAERGFASVSMEAIAARAGVGKPAIYRRFADKRDVVVAAIARALPPMEPSPAAGGARGHLRALIEQATPSEPERYAALIGGLMSEHRRHPELIAAFRESILLPRRAIVRAAIERAQREGVLRDDRDAELGVDLIGGAFLARAYAGLPMDAAWREALFESWWSLFAREPVT
ncbi:MAG TPA: TetR/AcrR family transcriptional regulator [Solirubrobacteraceae bacterium]|nr:TetR/AcrR family transcriptional regulator [Solirubrobacteraceae bacterium]